MKLSLILSTFNEEQNPSFQKTLDQLSEFQDIQVLCVDGGSTDNTEEQVRSAGFHFIASDCNTRAARLNKGIEKAEAPLILLHHPRSVLDKKGIRFLLQSGEGIGWGGFKHRFDWDHPILKWTSWYSNFVRGRYRGIIYLDHCIFFEKYLLPEGMPDVDIFEDTELSRLLRKKGTAKILPFVSRTSAVRFRKNGLLRQILMNQFLKLGYFLGFSYEAMNSFYEKGLSLNSRY